MSSIDDAINRFPEYMREPMHGYHAALQKELGAVARGFAETHSRLDRVDATLDRVAEGLDRLDKAQERTDKSLEKLAAAQVRTDESLEKLAKAQAQFGGNFDFRIGGLGDRWGMVTEGAFRSDTEELLTEAGFSVERFDRQDTEGMVFGHSERIELDMVVTNGTTILVEIKSSADFSDVHVFKKKSAFYESVSKRPADKLVLVAPYLTKRASDLAARLGVTVCTSSEKMEDIA